MEVELTPDAARELEALPKIIHTRVLLIHETPPLARGEWCQAASRGVLRALADKDG